MRTRVGFLPTLVFRQPYPLRPAVHYRAFRRRLLTIGLAKTECQGGMSEFLPAPALGSGEG